MRAMDLEYYAQETNRRLSNLEKKMDTMLESKAFILGQAKMAAIFISVVIGVVSLLLGISLK